MLPKIIAFNGPMASGKDTYSNYYGSILTKKGIKWSKYGLGTPPKREVDFILNQIKNGKTKLYICNELLKLEYFNKEDFDKMYDMCFELVGKDTSLTAFNRTPEIRKILQYWSTDVRRKYNQRYWLDIALKEIKKMSEEYFIITDPRFILEFDELKKLEDKSNRANLIRNEVGKMGRAISKYMLSGISNIASLNFNKITGRTERIEWSNDEKDKYVLYLVGQERKIAFEQLSGGEQVSVAIAIRGTMTEYFTNSRFMILDEPTNNLDTERKKLLAEYMGEILKNLDQSIIVTHDDTFREMAEKIIEL